MTADAMPVRLGRPSLRSRRGIVATSQTHASEVGAQILANGGNAADAAVAAAAALAVTEPCSCGLGGDCFALYYDSERREVTALNGSGRSPAALSLDIARGEDGFRNPFSPHTVTVPGTAAAWDELIERHGSLALGDVLAPAIDLAADGFAVGEITSYFWRLGAAMQLKRWADNPTDLLVDENGPRPGETFRNPNMARVLDELGKGGRDEFYAGRVGRAIVAAVQRHGGLLSQSDLTSHRSEWVSPISTVHGGARVFECPPNGQGITALIAMNILGSLEAQMSKLESFDDPQRLHREIEALRLAFADARVHLADPSATRVSARSLLSPTYAADRARGFSPTRAMANATAGAPLDSSDTVYLATVDSRGNACSLIFSNYMGFGTGIVPEGCGFTLQNRGHNFSLEPGHANTVGGGKRPYHTIIPALALQEASGDLLACFGVMGGFMQPQGHLQTLRGLVHDRLDPQEILDRPRFMIDAAADGGAVALEVGLPSSVASALEALGHKTRWVDGWQRSAFGRGQMIVCDGDYLVAGSDPRADGCAVSA